MAAILNNNKSSKMEIAEVDEKFELPSGEIRYSINYQNKKLNAIPIAGTNFKPGDKVIIIFEDSKLKDMPFIINKINQKSAEEEKLIAEVKPIEKIKDTDSITQETPNSIIRMDDKRKRITIGNKNSPNAQIVLDNDQILVGGKNLTEIVDDIVKFQSTQANDRIMKSDRNLDFKAEDGSFKINAQEVVSISDNFIINNNNDLMISTNHVNFSASFVEFNAITPKGYDLKEKNAFSFFAVSGNYSISLGTGDFKLKSVSPASEFSFLIMPLTPFSGLGSSIGGMIIEAKKTSIAHLYQSSSLILGLSSFKTEIFYGLSLLKLSATKFNIDLLYGVVNMSLSPTSFKVTIAGNSLTLSPAGLKISAGNITATAGDVKAMGGTYSLMKHKHPTAVPGGPSPPLPG